MSDAASRVRVPAKPPATVRRKMPAPFARPSITISADASAPRRTWRHILAADLVIGDTVPGIGVIHDIVDVTRGEDGGFDWQVTIHGGDDNVRTIRATEIVMAYVAE